MHTEPLEIVEIDCDRCPLTYGVGACTAALSATTPDKCHNTWETCQDRDNYRRDPETNLADPDITAVPGDAINTLTRTADFFGAFDVVFPASPSGAIYEQGDNVRCLYLGVTSGDLVLRAGDSTSTPVTGVRIAADVTPYAGKRLTLYCAVDMTADTATLWAWDSYARSLTEVATGASTAAFGQWASAGDGSIGSVNGTLAAGEDATDFNGTVSEARFWDGLAAPDMPDKFRRVLRFAANQDGLPKGQTVFPVLQSVTDSPGELNLGGIDPNKSPLGKRAKVTVALRDFAYHDTAVDDYAAERKTGAAQFDGVGYDPAERSTFFAKFHSRWPYMVGKALRVKRGEVGQAIADMRTEHYVISGLSGPTSSGAVSIEAKDILDLVSPGKAQAPAASTGTVLNDISASDLAIELSPTGIGNLEYPQQGRAMVGREVVRFSRAADVLVLLERGVDGTTASSHSAGDLVQLCLRYEDQTIASVVYDLLVTQAGVDPTFCDLAAWENDDQSWQPSATVTATLPNSTDVHRHIAGLCQMGVDVWWNQVDQRVEYRPNRPLEPDEAFVPLTDAAHIIEDTGAVTRLDAKRLTGLIVHHGIDDVSESATYGNNYKRAAVAVSSQTEAAAETERVKSIYLPWFGNTGNDAAAGPIADRLMTRYERAPRQFSGRVALKDRDSVQLGVLAQITSRLLASATGETQTMTAQIGKVTQHRDGLSFQAESYGVDERWGFIMANGSADFDSATADEIADGLFLVDETTLDPGDGLGPYLLF